MNGRISGIWSGISGISRKTPNWVWQDGQALWRRWPTKASIEAASDITERVEGNRSTVGDRVGANAAAVVSAVPTAMTTPFRGSVPVRRRKKSDCSGIHHRHTLMVGISRKIPRTLLD